MIISEAPHHLGYNRFELSTHTEALSNSPFSPSQSHEIMSAPTSSKQYVEGVMLQELKKISDVLLWTTFD